MDLGENRAAGQAMRTRWRQRRMCILLADIPVPAAIGEISARGAFLETNCRPAIGSAVELRHPEAGAIAARVRAHAGDGVSVDFRCDARSVAFVLAVIGADMSRPAA